MKNNRKKQRLDWIYKKIELNYTFQNPKKKYTQNSAKTTSIDSKDLFGCP